jgi:hypothetical protein
MEIFSIPLLLKRMTAPTVANRTKARLENSGTAETSSVVLASPLIEYFPPEGPS